MEPAERRLVGHSGVTLPVLGLGGVPFGELYVRMSDDRTARTLDAAWDAGIRYFDTAPYYGHGLSEHRVGRALRERPRHEVILSTKVGRVLRPTLTGGALDPAERAPWIGGLDFTARFDYSYDGVMRSYEDSLQRLGLPRVDLLVIHDLDIANHGTAALVDEHFRTLDAGGFRALTELRSAGAIGAIGAGVNRLGTIPRFASAFDLDFFLVALPYTLATQDALDVELPLCTARGISVVIGSVYASGILATGPIPGARLDYREPTYVERDRIAAIAATCGAHGVPLPAAALQFPLHHPAVAAVLPGADSPEHVMQSVAGLRHEIPAALWSDLKVRGLIRADAPTP